MDHICWLWQLNLFHQLLSQMTVSLHFPQKLLITWVGSQHQEPLPWEPLNSSDLAVSPASDSISSHASVPIWFIRVKSPWALCDLPDHIPSGTSSCSFLWSPCCCFTRTRPRYFSWGWKSGMETPYEGISLYGVLGVLNHIQKLPCLIPFLRRSVLVDLAHLECPRVCKRINFLRKVKFLMEEVQSWVSLLQYACMCAPLSCCSVHGLLLVQSWCWLRTFERCGNLIRRFKFGTLRVLIPFGATLLR